jgi:hypothetical protein
MNKSDFLMFKGVKISILDFPLRLTDQRSSLSTAKMKLSDGSEKRTE